MTNEGPSNSVTNVEAAVAPAPAAPLLGDPAPVAATTVPTTASTPSEDEHGKGPQRQTATDKTASTEAASEQPDGDSLPEENPDSNNPPAETAAAVAAKRYLGGSSISRSNVAPPVWFRLFVIGIAIAVSFAGLLSLLTFPFASEDQRPRVLCAYVQEYVSPIISSNSFASQDVARIIDVNVEQMTGNANCISINETNDVRRFLDNRLTQIDGDVCVVYLSAHSHADESTAWFLPATADSTEKSNGFTVDELLNAVADSRVRNMLVVIETGRFRQNLDLGVVTNRTAAVLQSAFEEKCAAWMNEPVMAERNVVLVCAANQGQVAWSSPTLRGSPFAMALAYGLRGAAVCDGLPTLSSGSQTPLDGLISAIELATFTQQTTANWSMENRGVLQLPIIMHFGDDFTIRQVDPAARTHPDLELSTTPSTNDQTESTASAKTGGVSPGQGPAQTATVDSVKRTEKGSDEVKRDSTEPAAPVVEVTATSEEQDSGPATVGEQPTGVARSANSSDSEVEAVAKILHRIASLRSRQSPSMPRPHRRAWFEHSISHIEDLIVRGQPKAAETAFIRRFGPNEPGSDDDDDAAPDTEFTRQMLSVLEQPTDAGFDALQDDRSSVAELLRLFGSRLRQGEQWIDPTTTRLAIETRALASGIGRAAHPQILAFYRPRIEEADYFRRRAEVQLMDRGFSKATPLLHSAMTIYRTVEQDIESDEQTLGKIEAVAVFLPWYAGLTMSHARQTATIDSTIQRFLSRLQRFVENPTADRMRILASDARAVRAAVDSVVTKSLTEADQSLLRDALPLPNVSGELHSSVRQRLIDARDGTTLQTGYSGQPTQRNLRPDTRLLVSILRFADDKTSSGGSFDNRWIAESISKLREEGLSASRGNWWNARFRSLVAARWMGCLPDHLQSFDVAADTLNADALRQRTEWSSSRIQQDMKVLPIAFADGAFAPGDQSEAAPFVYSGDPRPLLTTTNQPLMVPFTLTATEAFAPEVTAKLVLQCWPADACQLKIGDIDGAGGRVEYSLQDFVAGSEESISLRISRIENRNLRLSMSLRMSDGTIQWLPITVESKPIEATVASLQIEWPDDGVSAGKVELLPNQSIPIDISVEKSAPGVAGLRVEFIGKNVATFPVPDGKATRIPIVAAPDFAFECADGGLKLRLLQGETLLDERQLDVAVLDPAQCFRCKWTFEPTQRHFSAGITRSYRSDSAEPTSFQLRTRDQSGNWVPLGESSRQILRPQDRRIRLNGTIPFSARQPLDVALNVGGVGRLFRQQFSMQHLTGRTDDSVTVRIDGIHEGARYAATKEQMRLPIHVQADGPGRRSHLSVGIDRNGNRLLDSDEELMSREFRMGRESKIEVVSTGKPERMLIRSQVDDPVFAVDLTGREGPTTIVVAAESNGRRATDAVEFFLVNRPPTLNIIWPQPLAQIAGDRPLRVTVRADTPAFRAVEAVEFGFDKNENGRFDEAEAVKPVPLAEQPVRFMTDPKLTVHLPLTGLKPGPFTLLVRTLVSVGEYSKPETTRVLSSKATAQTLELVTIGHIAGRVQLADGTPVFGAAVSIPDRARTYSNENGEYSFNNVSPGTYRVNAMSTSRSGMTSATVRPVQVTRADITILVN